MKIIIIAIDTSLNLSNKYVKNIISLFDDFFDNNNFKIKLVLFNKNIINQYDLDKINILKNIQFNKDDLPINSNYDNVFDLYTNMDNLFCIYCLTPGYGKTENKYDLPIVWLIKNNNPKFSYGHIINL